MREDDNQGATNHSDDIDVCDEYFKTYETILAAAEEPPLVPCFEDYRLRQGDCWSLWVSIPALGTSRVATVSTCRHPHIAPSVWRQYFDEIAFCVVLSSAATPFSAAMCSVAAMKLE